MSKLRYLQPMPEPPAEHTDVSQANPNPKELEILGRNFSFSIDEQMLGYAGAPAYVRRLKNWEERLEQFWARLERQYGEVLLMDAPIATRKEAWQRRVEGLEIEEIQEIAEEFNRYFPIEANLGMDMITNQVMYRGEPWVPVTAPTRKDVLTRFPLPS